MKKPFFYPMIRLIFLSLVVSFFIGFHNSYAEGFKLPVLEWEETDQLSTRSSLFVRDIEFSGNAIFYDFEFDEISASYKNREVTLQELETLRQELTYLYVNGGYINSGVILKDQDIGDGVVEFTIVEGTLTEIHVKGNKRLRTGYLEDRIWRGSGPVLNIHRLQNKLQLIRLNPNVKRINAELKPGLTLGQSILSVEIEEHFPLEVSLWIDNHRTPSVGAERIFIDLVHGNVLGNSDNFRFLYGITKDGIDDIDFAGLDDYIISYATPVNSFDTSLQISYKKRDFSIVEDPFQPLDIESETEEIVVNCTQPLIKTPNHQLSLSLSGEYRKSNSELLGIPFEFSEGAINGETQVTVLRFIQEWVHRNSTKVLAFRSSFNFGVDLFDPSMSKQTSRDGDFFSWIGQVQYIRRSQTTGNHLILRANGQVTDDKLLSLEQFGVGGSNTVRGYRENSMVRDRGIATTIELRIPLIKKGSGKEILWFAPFFDYGWASDVGKKDEDFEVIASMGSGLLFTPNDRINCEIYWGHQVRDVNRKEDDIQDKGLHFSLSFKFL